MKKLTIKTPLVIYGIIALILRLFYFQLDSFLRVKVVDTLYTIILFSTIFFFCMTVSKAIFKEFKPLLMFTAIFVILYCVPYEFINGWIQFKFNSNNRMELVSKLKTGAFDSLLSKRTFLDQGGRFDSYNPRYRVFKDNTLQMIFLWQGNIRNEEEYCGQLYVSDTNQIDSRRVAELFGSDFHKKYLGDNWYWVDSNIDRTPAP